MVEFDAVHGCVVEIEALQLKSQQIWKRHKLQALQIKLKINNIFHSIICECS